VKTLSLILSGLILTGTAVHAASAEEGLNYLNTMRKKSGLWEFKSNDALQEAAQNHSRYLQINNASGHYEEEGKDGFTGEEASDRVVSAGYASTIISENLSGGQPDVFRSIDGLMSALYHRLTFLHLERDEIGIGIEGEHYTYNLGNSALNDLCLNHTYQEGNYYYQVCKDPDKKIEEAAYLEAQNRYKTADTAPDTVLWPPVNADAIPPAFYDEIPDPLPDYSVSGYPVSVQFNDARFAHAPQEVSLEIQDDHNRTLENILLMDKDNDPEHRLSEYEFALFPKKHMEWGHTYYATLRYEDQTKRWCFATRSLTEYGAQRVYRFDAESDQTTVPVVSGRWYALYFVPQNEHDIFKEYEYTVTYRGDAPEIDLSFIDWNTLLFSIRGDSADEIRLDVNTTAIQNITLVIADDDTAALPEKAVCEEVSDTATSDMNSTETSPEVSAESPVEEELSRSSAGGVPVAVFFLMLLFMVGIVRRAET